MLRCKPEGRGFDFQGCSTLRHIMLIKLYDNHARLMVKITPGRSPGTHCGEGCFDPGASLRGNGKNKIYCLNRVSKPEPSGPQRVTNAIAIPFPSRHRSLRVAGCISHILHYDKIFTGTGSIPYIKS